MQKIISEVLQKLNDQCPQMPFAAEFWDGTLKHYGNGGGEFKIVFRSAAAVKKIINGGSLAFGEEYASGNIVVEGDLQAMLGMYDRWHDLNKSISLVIKAKILWNLAFSRHTIAGAGKNARFHYDIGNDFYSLWLDGSLTYSCAYFKSVNDNLETAQNNKYEHICRKLQLKDGESLVDIGCGWGQMMFYAAKNYGVVCTGYTLAKNQYDYISAKIKQEGLMDRVKVHLRGLSRGVRIVR